MITFNILDMEEIGCQSHISEPFSHHHYYLRILEMLNVVLSINEYGSDR